MFAALVLPLLPLVLALVTPATASPGETRLGWDFSTVPGDGVYTARSPAWLIANVTDNDAPEDNDDWKVCTWRRESDGAYCRYEYICEGFLCDIGSGDFSIQGRCSDQLQDLEYIGEDPNFHNRKCGVKIPSMDLPDSSRWTIEVEECRVTGCGSGSGNGVVRRYTSQQTVMQEPSSVSLSSPTLTEGGSFRPGLHNVTLSITGIRPEPRPAWLCQPGLQCTEVSREKTDGPNSTVSLVSTATVNATQTGTFTVEAGAEVRNTTGDYNMVWRVARSLTFSVSA